MVNCLVGISASLASHCGKKDSKWLNGCTSSRRYHVEEVPDLDSPAQVPDVDVPVVAGRQHDAGVEGVGFQHKNLVIVTLSEDECVCVFT